MTDDTDRTAYLGRRQILTVLGALMLGMLLAALDQTIVSTALPTIVGDLGGLNHLSWVVTAYLLAATISTPLYGKLGDLYGRKPFFQVAIAIFLVGSMLSGLSQNMLELIGFRALQGLGAGGLMVSAQAIIGDVVPPRERGKYQGMMGGIFALASIAGPLLGGFLTDNASWRWIFYINVPLGAVALVVTATALPSTARRVSHRIDWWGAALLAAGTSSVILLATWGGTQYGWLSAPIIALAVVGAAVLVTFFVVERRVAEPIIPPRLFRSSVFNVASAVGFVIGFALFGAIVFLPLFLQLVDGASATSSGLNLLPLMVGLLAASIGSGPDAVWRSGRDHRTEPDPLRVPYHVRRRDVWQHAVQCREVAVRPGGPQAGGRHAQPAADPGADQRAGSVSGEPEVTIRTTGTRRPQPWRR